MSRQYLLKYIDQYKENELPYSRMHEFIDLLLNEYNKSNPTLNTYGGLTYKDIFEQEDIYNGHGQLIVKNMGINDIFGLISEMEENIPEEYSPCNNIFHLALYRDSESKYSGTIYQSLGAGLPDRMWLSIEEVDLND